MPANQILLPLILLLASSASQAQVLIDEYGFYKSWRELNTRYFAKKVKLDERGLEQGTDTRASKISDNGFYRVSIEPEITTSTNTAPFNQIHNWRISIQALADEASAQPELEFFGGMPLHNHGFPTSQFINPGSHPGQYRLSGIKFSMTGWWQFAFAIKSAESIDTIRFNLVINP